MMAFLSSLISSMVGKVFGSSITGSRNFAFTISGSSILAVQPSDLISFFTFPFDLLLLRMLNFSSKGVDLFWKVVV